jgi:hypothetical protein
MNKQKTLNNKRLEAQDVAKTPCAFAHRGGLLFIDYYLLKPLRGFAC